MAVMLLFYFVFVFGSSLARDVHFYVSPSGSDANNGSDVRHPLKTITKALRYADSSTYTSSDNLFVELLAGYHDLDSPLGIYRHHAKLLTIRSYNGQKVHVTGGRQIPASSFHSVRDHNILNALPQSSRSHVKYVNLPSLNITNYGTLAQYGFHTFRSAPLEIFHNGRPFRPAQWPNEGYINVVGIPDGAHGKRVQYNSTRPASWRHLDDLWTYGFWWAGWADRSAKVASLDTKNMIVTFDNTTSRMIGLKTGHWGEAGVHSEGGYFRFINVLSELDQPGEYYLDRKTGNLYVWLPSSANTDVIQVSMLRNCIELHGKPSNIVLSNFILETCRERGIFGVNVKNIHLTNMEVRNTGDYGIQLSGDSRDCSVTKSVIHDGDGAVYLQGGNRKLLESGGNVVEDCDIYQFARVSIIGKDAVVLSGVGNMARYNHIHDGPTTAIRYYDNDHIIEYNDLHHLCNDVTYCAAIYSSTDWTFRGIKIRYNHIHEIFKGAAPGNQVQAIHLDQQLSSAEVTNNVLYNNEVHINLNGGRDNIITNNLLYNATKYSVYVNGRQSNRPTEAIVRGLHNMPYNGTLWRNRYPELADIDTHNRSLPIGNQIYKNLVFAGPNVEFLHGMTGWKANQLFFNISDFGFSFGPGDHFNPSVGDLRVRCHAATWANKVNFQQVVSPNMVGPRYDVGPSFNKIVRKTVSLSVPHGACAVHQAATMAPKPAYLPDGSGQTPIHKVYDEDTRRYIKKSWTYILNFSAVEQWKFCGSKKGEGVAAIYGPTGAMTMGGEGCFIATYGCPKHGGPADGQAVNGTIYRDVFAENVRNASIDEEKCLARSSQIWGYCGSNPNHTVTAIFMSNGHTRTTGSGCWIETDKCPKQPNQHRIFYDAYGATYFHTDEHEIMCLERARVIWTECGSDSRYPVTARYRPTAKFATYP